ncbi:methylated-DNA--protein-cysteine methyltransferase [Rhizocola hellebori]|uniref:Methylated-DNA--protein-cysteine methyltransferase n=1 Tax=Rhizocola hellebori TaxID=1392758 RepID=A0A8J3QH42_9ACTN|nr:methylated-DNA--[protein]-cysteine S-methyltransferase [Rhizocola hellebori]GIH09932.1 methylated-DNA--protein-cysteine methyltransferase [Rhizocola hellebori]
MRWSYIDSPIGELSYALDDTGVCSVHFGLKKDATLGDDEAARQLRAYFDGSLTDFDLPLSVRRGSEFERAVWRQMQIIPYGETKSYGYVAAAVGEPGGAQAVGTACNRNPLPVIVPCHRIIGSDGKLVGFGGGLERKRILLELEANVKMQLDWGIAS